MSQPTKRRDSNNWWFKQRVEKSLFERAKGQSFEIFFPAKDNVPELRPKAKFGQFLTFTLGTTDRKLALIRCAMADIEYFNACDRIRANTSTRVDPEITSIARTLFEYFQNEHSLAEPPLKYDWSSIDGIRQASKELMLPDFYAHKDRGYTGDDGRYSLLKAHSESYPNDDRSLNAMESRYGVICTWALAYKKMRVPDAKRYQMLCDFESCLNQARVEQARQKASFKSHDVDQHQSTEPISFQKLFDKWVKEKNPKLNSIRSWRGKVKSFVEFLGHDDATKVTSFDVERWKDTFTADSNPSIMTAQVSHFPCIRRMYSIGLEYRMLSYDPTSNLSVSLKNVDRERVIPYTPDEMRIILTEAYEQNKAHLKWLPILTALTGARIGELGQLWEEQVKRDPHSGIWYLDIKPSPDGGYIKTRMSWRRVPIHRGILNEFLAFCGTRKGRPLFYDKVHEDKDKAHPGQSFSQRLSVWYRTLNLDLNRKLPNHSMRHYFKSAAIHARANMDFIHALQGHATDKGSYERYQHFRLDDLLHEIERIPFPTICVPADTSRSKE